MSKFFKALEKFEHERESAPAPDAVEAVAVETAPVDRVAAWVLGRCAR